MEIWPELPFEKWKDTCATVHMWTHIIGKIRLVQTPWTNHSWHVTLYVDARGLTTSPIPYQARTYEIRFDFIEHQLAIETSDGGAARMALEAQSVASFYGRAMEEMAPLGLRV